MQLVGAGPSFKESPSGGYVFLVVVLVVGILVVGALLYTLSKSRRVRRFYKASRRQIAKENAEFSSDSSDASDR